MLQADQHEVLEIHYTVVCISFLAPVFLLAISTVYIIKYKYDFIIV